MNRMYECNEIWIPFLGQENEIIEQHFSNGHFIGADDEGQKFFHEWIVIE